MHLTHIYTYPIKSLAGIAQQSAQLTGRGLLHDRRWMLVRPDGTFITARRVPKMVLLSPHFRGEELYVGHLHAPIEPLHVPLQPRADEKIQVQVWDDQVPAQVVSPEADEWFTMQLGTPCRLVYMPDQSHRQTDPRYAQAGEWVSFADGFPYLILGQASLQGLNDRLSEPMHMTRFRPNLVFSGGEAHAEDSWKSLQIGKATFALAKPCARCVLTTVDPHTARSGPEPLRTLSSYRTVNSKVLFGMNALLREGSQVQVGDQLQVRE